MNFPKSELDAVKYHIQAPSSSKTAPNCDGPVIGYVGVGVYRHLLFTQNNQTVHFRPRTFNRKPSEAVLSPYDGQRWYTLSISGC